MSVGRRRFFASVSAGSAAYLTGCATPTMSPLAPDGGALCPTVIDPDPPALDFPAPSYFDQLSLDLDARTIGTPVVFVDLDRMESNIDVIRDAIRSGPSPKRFRIVEKSLPSIDLLRLVSARAGSESFLVLHLPLLPQLLAAFPDADVISGKTHLTSAVERFFLDLAEDQRASAAARVVFLADSVERVRELASLASALTLRLRVSIEIDIGLRRSGVSRPAELAPVLMALRDSSSLELAGLFGYEGHVVHTPLGTSEAARAAWDASMDDYRAFAEVLEDFPDLVRDELVFHSGGTTTFALFGGETPVGDVATGGGVLRPGEYSDMFLAGLVPAIFVASPVLRQYDAPRIPFLNERSSASAFGGRQGITVYGGGWPAYFTYPRVTPSPLSGTGCGAVPLVPNQGLLAASAEPPLEIGDWIYFHPLTSDVIFQFERIHTVRGGRLTGETLGAYPRRY